MTFDPFGDYERAGYLRNRFGFGKTAKLQELEFIAVNDSLEEAFEYLEGRDYLEYRDVLEVHRLLFETVYPWAGADREKTVPGKSIKKGSVEFCSPTEIPIALTYALKIGQDVDFLREKPGVVLGQLAFAHPFLDGNGRTIMLVFTELLFRAGIRLDWSRSLKDDYLAALSKEIEEPDKGHLDGYLAPLIGPSSTREQMLDEVIEVRGLFKTFLQS